MTMSLLFEPEHDETVYDHGHRRGTTNGLFLAVSGIFKSEQLLAVVETNFNRPGIQGVVRDSTSIAYCYPTESELTDILSVYPNGDVPFYFELEFRENSGAVWDRTKIARSPEA